MEKDIFILDRPPQPFREDVIHTSTSSVHADFDVVLKNERGEIATCELDALIRVPDFRSCDLECIRDRVNAEVRFKRRRHFPCDDISAEPIKDGREIGEAAFQFHIGDVRPPNLIRFDDIESAKQIWIFLMRWVALAQSLVFSRINGFYAHLLHQMPDVVPANRRLVVLRQFITYPT